MSFPPTIIHVKKDTLLCRWEDDIPTSSCEGCDPPSQPTRQKSPCRNAGKQRLASLRSGVNINSIRLLPVKFDPQKQGKCKMATNLATPLSKVLALHSSGDNDKSDSPTAVFCIRRAGCGSCRDHGRQLAKVAKQVSEQTQSKVRLVGIVKKTDAPEGLLEEFYKEYFPFPIYQDEEWDAFKFLGHRKISPWQLLSTQPRLLKRYQERKVKNVPFGGDIFTQGGVLLFDGTGTLRYVYYEEYGHELDTEALTWALQECQRKRNART